MGNITYGTLPNFDKFTKDGSVTVGNTSTLVLPANPNRIYAMLTNDSDEAIYLAFGTAAVLNKTCRLNPNGGVQEYSPAMANLFTGPVYAICATGGKNLLTVEA